MGLVSIIIPCYNASRWLSETIESCLKQGDCVKEIIVIDDHSLDNSWEVASWYRDKYPNVIKLEKNNGKGGNRARNYGFSISSGQFIQWLDADDILSINKINAQLELFKKFGNDIVTSCSWIKFIDNISEGILLKQVIDNDYDKPIQWLIDSWNGMGMGQTAIWLVSRKMVEEIGCWNENLKINQDGEFFCRILLQAKAIRFSKDSFVFYRSNLINSVSKKKGFEIEKSKLESYKLYEEILNIDNSEKIRLALARNYMSFIYETSPEFNTLIKEANYYIKVLNINKKKILVGGEKFKLLTKIFGFNFAMIIKKKFSN